MFKKIVGILIPVLLLTGGVYIYFHLEKEDTPKNTAIKAIPIDASFILESRKTLPLWRNIVQTNTMWKNMLDIPYFASLNKQCRTLDSITRENGELETILEGQPLFISAHINGMNSFNYLFTCAVPETTSQASLSNYLDLLKCNHPANNLQYEETTIHSLQIDEKSQLYYTISNGVFISSFSSALIKESLRQIESGISLMNNAYFTKILNTAGQEVAANIFINCRTLANVSSCLFAENFLPTLSSIQNFGQWMGLDVTINHDEFIMTGFTDCDSTGSQYLNLFEHQSSHEIQVASVAPANTAFMICHEFSDYGAFHKSYIQYIARHNKNRNREEWINKIEQNYGLDIEKYFYPWINNEAAQIITEPSDNTLQNDTYVLIKSTDATDAISRLSALADTIAFRKKVKAIDSVYLHHTILNLNLDNVTGNILGSSFDGVTKSWVTSVGSYIVFANSIDALKAIIYQYEGNNTLEKDSYYKDYIKQHVSSESGIYIYNNMALSPVLYSKYLDKLYTTDIKKYKDIFNKFNGASIQFSYLKGMFYTNIYIKSNPSTRKEINLAWKTGLDTTIASGPWWVTDYLTHTEYAMAEDKNKSIYFINNTGRIEWKKKIDGYIQSSIFQVDALKNHKTQYLFNTAHTIGLLDRKGNYVNAFPVKLNYSASATLAVLDYDNNKNYKLLIPCYDLKVHEYDITGNPVHGWIIPETKEIVKCPAHYLQIAQKDYIIFIDDAGKVYALDRKGNEKLNLTTRMPEHIHDFYITKGKSLSDSYIMAADSSGTIFKLSLSGELSTIQYLKHPQNNTYFIPGMADSTGKQEMVFLCDNNLWAYNADKTERFHTNIKDKPDSTPLLFTYPDHSLKIGAVDQESERIYLWDNTGTLIPGFPLRGSKYFAIADVKNNGSLYLVTGADNRIYVYALQ